MARNLSHQVYAARIIAEVREHGGINGLTKTLPIHLGMNVDQIPVPRDKFDASRRIGKFEVAERGFHALPLDIVPDEH